MKISSRSKIKDVIIFSLDKRSDERGSVVEVFDEKTVSELLDNSEGLNFLHETYSKKDVLRGIHYQFEKPQSRLVRVSYGAIYDVVLDLRRSSPTFGKWQAEILTSENSGALWVPSGLGHAYLVLSDFAIINIHSSGEYESAYQRTIRWNDPELLIDWPLYANYPIITPPTLSQRDQLGVDFQDAEYFS